MSVSARVSAVQGHLSGVDDRLRPAASKATSEPAPVPFHNKSGLRYTIDSSCAEFPEALSMEERLHYEEFGYVIKRKIVPEYLVDKLNQHYTDLVQGTKPLQAEDHAMTLIRDIGMLRKIKRGELPKEYANGEYGVYKIQGRFDDQLMEWVRYPELVKVARCFAGPDIKSLHHMSISKPPDVGENTSIHPLHQDYAYFPWTSPDNTVGCWTALCDVNRENGCLVVIPGSHKEGLIDHDVPEWLKANAGFHTTKNAVWRGTEDYAVQEGKGQRKLLFAEMGKGDTIFFHPEIIHGSGFNTTQACRKSITVHYASARSRYFPLQQFFGAHDYISHEVMTSLRRVKAGDVTDTMARQANIDNWKFTSRLIAGHDYRNELKIDDYL